MNFFQSQDTARRKTTLLVVYYALAVLLIIVGVYFAISAAFIGLATSSEAPDTLPGPWELFGGVAIGTLMIIGCGSLYKVWQLRGGGSVVALSLGGREVSPSSAKADERKLLNIVEEISIASGVPMPRVFIMDAESGINAFAAGYSAEDAVIAVTRGSLEQFTRDELQGVVAHEFSHILNGDMRLNIKLMGILNGILVIGMLGYFIMRMTMFSSGRRSRSDKKGGTIPIALMGLIIMAVGYVGVFFGKLIKAAVSRQREFLADASAVQFTRNPDGIANALKRIGGFAHGSRIENSHAEEAAHFFFAYGLRQSHFNAFATHPPLLERIRRIDASFDGRLTPRETGSRMANAAAPEGTAGFAASAPGATISVSAEEAVARVGAPTSEHVAYARQVLADLPDRLVAAAREPFGACAVVYALLLDPAEDIRSRQLARLGDSAAEQVYAEVCAIAGRVRDLPKAHRIPLIDITIPALRALSKAQFEQFKRHIEGLVSADMQVDLFEYTLQRIIVRQLDPAHGAGPRSGMTHKHMASALPACAQLLSSLAGWGAETQDAAERAFKKGWRELLVKQDGVRIPAELCGLQSLDDALNDLEHATPSVKQRIVAACVSCIGADGKLTTEEAELIRAICDALHCPMPPFLQSMAPV